MDWPLLFVYCLLSWSWFHKNSRALPSYYSYIYSWSFKNSWAPHCCSSSCLSSLFWTSTPLRVNIIKGTTMCVNIALNYYFISLKNHKGSTIIWIVNFYSFLSSIPCKVSMFKTWFKLMFQKFFCKLGLYFTTHYQWRWNDKKEIRVYIWKLCYFHIYRIQIVQYIAQLSSKEKFHR
jgi:hypothetical protein